MRMCTGTSQVLLRLRPTRDDQTWPCTASHVLHSSLRSIRPHCIADELVTGCAAAYSGATPTRGLSNSEAPLIGARGDPIGPLMD